MPAVGEMIIFPDHEALVVAALNAEFTTRLPGVRASTKVPNPRPTEFVRVIRAGGPKETLITENGSEIVEAWAETEARAVTIINMCRAVLNAQDGVLFGVTEISGPSNLPDPTTSAIRYTQMFGIRARATVTA